IRRGKASGPSFGRQRRSAELLRFLAGDLPMHKTWSVVVAFVVAVVLAAGLRAADKNEVTLKGTILCAKCALKEAKKCQTAIQVKEDGKTVTYYLDDKGMKEEYHEPVCGGDRKEGAVTGVVHVHD